MNNPHIYIYTYILFIISNPLGRWYLPLEICSSSRAKRHETDVWAIQTHRLTDKIRCLDTSAFMHIHQATTSAWRSEQLYSIHYDHSCYRPPKCSSFNTRLQLHRSFEKTAILPKTSQKTKRITDSIFASLMGTPAPTHRARPMASLAARSA